jgi:hypothetical protein
VGYAPRAPQTSGNLGTWALLLAIASALLSIIGVFIWFAVVGQLALDRVGPNATEQQLQQALQEIMIRRGAPANPAAATVLLVGTFCGIVALVLGIRSLIGREGRTGRAIAACVIAAVFVFCQIMLMLAILQQHTMSTSLQAG